MIEAMHTRSKLNRGTVRLADVAAAAGVSISTASLVLRGKSQRYNQETQARIRRAAKQLGWRPNALVRGLQSGKTRMIGVLVPPYDFYWSHILAGIHRELARRDYVPITLWMSEDENHFFQTAQHDDGLQQINRLIDRRVEGFILWPVAVNLYEQHLRELIARKLPVVTIDAELHGTPADAVATDETMGAELVARHLLSLGHRRIACLSASDLPFEEWAVQRRTAFEAAVCKQRGASVKTWKCGESEDVVAETARALLRDPFRPTAVFCVTDFKASVLYRVAAEEKIQIPRDLSVVGFADMDIARMLDPPLTTVHQHPVEIGRIAAALLLDRIEKAGARPRALKRVPCELVVRQSSGPVA